MYCFKCGYKSNENEKFCKNCGNNISNNIYDNQFNYNLNYNKISEEDYIKSYIGNNYEKIKKEKISFPTLFLSIYYLLYRKMWLYSILWILMLIFTYILTLKYNVDFLILMPVIFNIIMAINFNRIYLNNVEKNVEKIKNKNLSKSSEEILNECKRKGGGSIVALIFSIIFTLIIVSVLVFDFMYKIIIDEFKSNNIKQKDDIELIYEVPKIFENNNKRYDSYKYYNYFGDRSSCTISVNSSNIYTEKAVEEYLKSDVVINMDDTVSDVLSKNINGVEWKYVEVNSKDNKHYHYAVIYNNKVYLIGYDIYNDEDKLCSISYKKFINSLAFKNNMINSI